MRTRFQLIDVGREFYCGGGVYIRPDSVTVGDYVFIGPHCHIASKANIGNFVMFASNVSVVGGDHLFDKTGVPMIFSGRDVNKPVVIGDDVWVGHGAIIMHGISIGEGAIVAAGSVVTRSLQPYTISGGVPAKIIRKRFDEEEQRVHTEMLRTYRETQIIDSNWIRINSR